jgi:hypothetical protein
MDTGDRSVLRHRSWRDAHHPAVTTLLIYADMYRPLLANQWLRPLPHLSMPSESYFIPAVLSSSRAQLFAARTPGHIHHRLFTSFSRCRYMFHLV